MIKKREKAVGGHSNSGQGGEEKIKERRDRSTTVDERERQAVTAASPKVEGEKGKKGRVGWLNSICYAGAIT